MPLLIFTLELLSLSFDVGAKVDQLKKELSRAQLNFK